MQRNTEADEERGTKISWLLQIVLENLGVTVSSYIVSNCFSLFQLIRLFLSSFNSLHLIGNLDAKPFGSVGSSASSKFTDYIDDCTALCLD